MNPELGERERERGLQRRWEEKGEKGIGSAVDAGTATMPSGPSATDVSSPAFSSTPEPPPILNGSPVSATRSALDWPFLPFTSTMEELESSLLQ
ncbi:unnamed protein product [Camellia sinensis]